MMKGNNMFYKSTNNENVKNTKTCSRCKNELPLDNFSNYKLSKDGKRPWCPMPQTPSCIRRCRRNRSSREGWDRRRSWGRSHERPPCAHRRSRHRRTNHGCDRRE